MSFYFTEGFKQDRNEWGNKQEEFESCKILEQMMDFTAAP